MTFESNTIKNVQSCDLQKALDLITLKYTPHPCKYNVIQTNSELLLVFGIVFSIEGLILFGIILFLFYKKSENKITCTQDNYATNDTGHDNAEGQMGINNTSQENNKGNFGTRIFTVVSIFLGDKMRYILVFIITSILKICFFTVHSYRSRHFPYIIYSVYSSDP